MIVWLIGLAGSGKSTIGRQLVPLMQTEGRTTVLLDGDEFRYVMGDDLGHDLEARRTNGWRMARMCTWLEGQGVDVVCCILSAFQAQRDWCRQEAKQYFEVYIDVPMPELVRRDQKGLYSGALAGNIKDVVGVDIPFPAPTAPDMVVANGEARSEFTSVARDIASAVQRSRGAS